MAPPDETDGRGGSEASLCSAMEDEEMEDTEKPSSSGQDDAALGGDHSVGGSTVKMKKRKDRRALADENGSGTKRILRSDVAKLRAEAQAARGMASEGNGHGAQHDMNDSDISERDGSDGTHCEGDVGKQSEDADVNAKEANPKDVLADEQKMLSCKESAFHNNTRELTTDACHGEDKDRKGASGTVNGSAGETARSSGNDAEGSIVDVIEVAEEAGFDDQANAKQCDARRDIGDEKVSSGIHEDDISCSVPGSNIEQIESRDEITTEMNIDGSEANEEASARCGAIIDKATAGNEDKSISGIGISNPTREVECVEQEDTGSRTERMEVHGSGEKKVEEHCHADVKKETEGACIESGRCPEGNEATQIGSTRHKKCENGSSGSVVPERKQEIRTPEKAGKGVAASERVFTRKNLITRKASATKKAKCEEEVQFEKRVTRSAAAKQREDAGSISKSMTDEAHSDRKERRDNVLPGHRKKANDHVFSKTNCTELAESGVDTDKQTFEAKLADQRDSGVTENDNPAEAMKNENMEAERKINSKLKTFIRSRSSSTIKKTTEEAVSAVDQNICSSAITERDDTELMDSEGVKFENRTALQKTGLSVGAKIVASKKRIMESELDKRGGGSAVATPSRKKTKTESSNTELELPEKSAGEKLTGKNCGSGKKSIQMKQEGSSPKVDRTRSVTRRSQKAYRLSENASEDLDAETDSNTSHRKILGGRSRGGVSVVLKKQENSSGSEEVTIMRKDRRKGKGSRHKRGAETTSKYSSVASKARRFGKSHSTKFESKSLTRQAERAKVKSPNGKSKVGKGSSIKSSSPSKHRSTGGLAEQKRKISEQIKSILLDAGWKIDLRPRNGRNYLDSVYIPPVGRGSYWSVTKAYSVFLRDMELQQNDKGKIRSPSKPSKGSPRKGEASTFCSLPEELLTKLKRTVVNKRTSKAVLQKFKKKKRGTMKKFKGSKGKAKEKNNKSSRSKRLHSGTERRKQGGCALLVRGSNQEAGSSSDSFVPYEWKRTVFSWLIDLDILSVNTKVKYMDESRTKVLLEGLVTRDGINCSCCSKVLPVFEFETHAGGEVCKPYRNILVDRLEVNLLHCLINAWDKQSDSERQAFFPINTDGDDPNDDTCGICGDGGDLICCDGCPSTFHMSCLGIEALPSDDWRCANCSCKFCQEHSTPDAEDIAEVDSSLLACSQCEEKYHQVCASEIDSISCISSHSGNLFCRQSCRQLFRGLQNLLAVKNDLEPGFSCRMIQRIDEDLPDTAFGLDQKVECNSKLAVALAIMDECFLPIIDQRTGINLIRNVVYNCGSNFVRLDFRGFYTFILERGDEIICAASIRIHGTRLAEMPFIGTRHMYRRQGMCRRFLDGIESILCSLKVEKLIIPAISELVDTWTNSFGFKPLEVSHKQEVKSISMLVFPGTGLLQKQLLSKASTGKSRNSQGVDTVSAEGKSRKASHEANEASRCRVADAEPQDSKLANFTDDGRDAVHCNGDISQESIGASCGPKIEASEDKSAYTTATEEFALHSKEACKDDTVICSKSQESSELKSNLGSMDTTEITEAKHVKDSDERELLCVEVIANKTSGECASVDIVANTESGEEDATNCHLVESASPRQHDENSVDIIGCC